MKFSLAPRRTPLVLLSLITLSLATYAAQDAATVPTQQQADEARQAGNFKEALEAYTKRLRAAKVEGKELQRDLPQAINCLAQLNRLSEFDALVESAIEAHPDDWRLLQAAAAAYRSATHWGYMISGEFERGNHRGGGKVMNATQRDRVRALQLLTKVLELAKNDPQASPHHRAEAAKQLADALLDDRMNAQAWQLQLLTDLDRLPDYEEGWGYGGGSGGAPVDEDNEPIFYDRPQSWDAAESDGERWRWALAQMSELSPQQKWNELTTRANFLRTQFGVTTLGNTLWPLWSRGDSDQVEREQSIYALHTLAETETLAKLATGIRRFELPDEHNFVLLHQQALEEAQRAGEQQHAYTSSQTLANLFADRRQYERSAEYWRLAIEHAQHPTQRENAQSQIDQIEKPWGEFGQLVTQPQGKGATLDFRFRNGTRVEFVAKQVKVRQLLDDVKAYIESRPRELDWNKLNLDQVGYRLVQLDQDKYVGDEVARWKVDLEPRENHFDRITTISSPLDKAGAYLVTANLEDGNTTTIVVWIADTAILKKHLGQQTLYYVADAVTGKPIEKANLELFGYRYERPGANQMRIDTENFAEFTDADGQAVVPVKQDDQHRNYQWLSIATTEQGRLAYLGFHNVWRSDRQSNQYERVSAFALTDRPVYRPGQQVHYKLWVQRAKYDAPLESEFAHKAFQLEIFDPRGERIETKQLTANAYGGIAGTLDLPEAATLGEYRFQLVNYGGGSFRVEEYKKPEFEVNVEAPSEPLTLGDEFEATISARYYFGEPVREGTVKYKVTRTTRDTQWLPVGPWDWLYGRGYWWFGYEYDWYPGWGRWGCSPPRPWWYPQRRDPPEIVAEGESPLDADGKLQISIDSSLAKELHPDSDHEYHIEAQVVDRSRRTIVGTGDVLVAQQPFEVYAWTDQGYYRTGDTITASFQARRPDGEPVEGDGKVQLVAVSYNEKGEPSEKEIRSWDLDTDAAGAAELQIKASDAGQYRMSYKVTVGEHTIEGAHLFTIVGQNFDGSDFRFSDLELVPDKQQYAPGDTMQLQVNANRPGSTILLFVRPENGVYDKPRMIRLEGKSTVVPIEIAQGDMPNFFVEAQTISSAEVHTVAKQIVVPPAKRVVNIDVVPSSPAYQPGQEAKVKIRLTDEEGQAVVGDTVLTVYDQSLDYIAGGAGPGDIREVFWGWKRDHHPQTEDNLDRVTSGITPPGHEGMQSLGAFGHVVPVEDKGVAEGAAFGYGGGRFRRRGLAGDMMERSMPAAAAAPMSMATADGRVGNELAGFKLSPVSDESREESGPGSGMIEPTVRKDFADTAYWNAAVETDSSGMAEVAFNMPENLTKWKFGVWSVGHGTRVGDGTATAVTRKNLLVRLQTPRFLVEKDEVVISANVHNYLQTDKEVRVRLELDGDYLTASDDLETTVEIEAGGEKRVDWRLTAAKEGTAVLRAIALTDQESDAMQLEVPVKVHGIEKLIAHSGVIAADSPKQAFEIVVPEQRRVGDTRLEVQFSPTLAGAMVDALPYLIDYPYGCTEQTLNRFVPAVLTQQTLRRMGVDLEAIKNKQTNLNPQELGDAEQRAEGWKRYKSNPVFDEAELEKVVKAGVQRLTEMQLADGGWGWFSGYGEHSSAHTTCTVLRGLVVAHQNEVAIVPGVIDQGVEWLIKYQSAELAKLDNYKEDSGRQDENKPYKVQADNLDALVYLTLVEAQRANRAELPEGDMDKMRGYLHRDRTKLAVYSMATFGLALEYQVQRNAGEAVADQRDMLLENLSQYVVTDEENQTAYLNLPGGFWWYWYGSEYEAHAYYLKLLAANDPESDVAAGMVKYLLNNRKHASYWNSTRDTALVVEAMSDYLAATGEGQGEMTVEVWLNGQRQKTVEITPDVLFSFDNRFVIEGGDIEAGRHTLELRKTGEGRLYYNAYLSLFSLEDDIQAAGLELKVQRKYYKLTPTEATADVAGGRGQAVSQKVEKYQRTEVPNLGEVVSGDLVEIELTVESKNDYEYILLEDLKAAGFEPVEVRSGYNGNELGAYMELRDDRVSLFVQRLARGTHSVSYRMRAETPGEFSALPTKASAMYAPELKGNSDELKVRVADSE